MTNRFVIALAFVGAAVSLAAGPASAKAETDTPYQQLRSHLFASVRTTAILTPSLCQNSQPQPPAQTEASPPVPAISGGFVIRDFMELNGKILAFANEHFTVQPSGASVLEFVQYRVKKDAGSATVTVRFLSPTTYQPLKEAQVYECVLGQGLRFAYDSRARD